MVKNGSAFSPTVALSALGALVLVVGLSACQDFDNGQSQVSGNAHRRISGVQIGASGAGNFLAGRFALEQRDLPAASRLLSRALASDPDNIDLLQSVMLSLASEGRMKQAADIALRLSERDPEASLAIMLLAEQDAKAGRWKEAEARALALPPKGANLFMAPLIVAWTRMGQDNIDGAIEALAPLSKSSSFATLHDFHVALIADLAGRDDVAADYYRATLSGDAGLSLRTLEAASAFFRRIGDQKMTEEVKEKQRYRLTREDGLEGADHQERLVRSASEGLAEAFFSAASAWRMGRLPEMALTFNRMAIDLQPDFALAKIMAAEILQDWGRLEEADKLYADIPPAGAVYWAARLRLASNQNALGDAEGALSTLRDLSQRHPDRADSLVAMGDILRQRERWAEAADAYAKAVAITPADDPDLWALYYSLGVCQERAKRWTEAENALLKSLELRPDEPHVLNYLGYGWIELGVNVERARVMIEKAVEQRPRDGYITDSLGWAYYKLGDYKKAVETLERAVELRPEDPTINDHFGDALWMVGRKAEAEFQWRRALTFNPEPDAKTLIEDKLAGRAQPQGKISARSD